MPPSICERPFAPVRACARRSKALAEKITSRSVQARLTRVVEATVGVAPHDENLSARFGRGRRLRAPDVTQHGVFCKVA